VNTVVRELEKEIGKMGDENDRLREECENFEREHNQLIE
jgi:hypothetical protein